MTEIIEDLKLQFNNLDSNHKKIDNLAASFIKYGKEDEETIEDLIKLWHHFFHNTILNNKISFIYLANIILQMSLEKNFSFHKQFLTPLIEVLPIVYKEAGEHDRKEIIKILDTWTTKNIFNPKDLEDIKHFITFIYNKDILDNPLFIQLLKTGKVKISQRVIDLCNAQVALNKSKENFKLVSNVKGKGSSDGNEMDIDKNDNNEENKDKIVDVDVEGKVTEDNGDNNVNKVISGDKIDVLNIEYVQFENKNRENLLKLLAEKNKEQFQNNIKDLMLLEEVDIMLHKIKTIKKNNGKHVK